MEATPEQVNRLEKRGRERQGWTRAAPVGPGPLGIKSKKKHVHDRRVAAAGILTNYVTDKNKDIVSFQGEGEGSLLLRNPQSVSWQKVTAHS